MLSIWRIYKDMDNNTIKNLLFSLVFVVVPIVGHSATKPVKVEEVHAQEVQVVESTPTPTLEPTPEPYTPQFSDPIKQYVFEVFGDDYPRAFDIIECESTWNTKAFNDNTTWGGIGQDRGLWQINNKFHPVTDECAYDYKCATDYAYRMYLNDHNQFNRWTCGR